MKKILNAVTIFVFVIMFVISGYASVVKADSNLIITNWSVISKLNNDGSLDVSEDITFKFSSKYNGVFRQISLNGTSGVKDISVFQIENGNITPFNLVKSASKGDLGVYEVNEKKAYDEVKIYSPSNNQEKTFRISYRVLNVAVRYNDTGEFFYNFLGMENETPIDKFSVKLSIPSKTINERVKIYAHGPLNGVIKFSGSDIILNVENVEPQNLVAARVLFPKENIYLSKNIVNEDVFNSIVTQENNYILLLKDKKIKKEFRKMYSNYGAIFFSFISFGVILLTMIKLKRVEKYDPDKYYNILPEECTPAVMKMLYSSYITNSDILATLLDLSRKGYIKIENSGENFGRKDKFTDFVIYKEKNADDNLLEHEKYFMSWLIDKLGDGSRVTLSGIQEFGKKNVKQFYKTFDEWKALVKAEAYNRGYFDNRGKKYGSVIMIFSILEFISGFLFVIFGSYYGILCVLLGIVLFVWGVILIYRKSDYGSIQIKRWKQFKEYYKKNEDSHPVDVYLIYAVALGMDKKTIEKYKLRFLDEYYNNANYFWIYWYFALNDSGNNNMFNESIGSAFGSVAPSNGSGGGASGGDGGAGGGGAGGF